MPLKDDHQPPADDRAGQSVGYLSAADLQTARSLTARMAAGEASRDAVLGILTIVATGTPPCRSGAGYSRSGDGKGAPWVGRPTSFIEFLRAQT